MTLETTKSRYLDRKIEGLNSLNFLIVLLNLFLFRYVLYIVGMRGLAKLRS